MGSVSHTYYVVSRVGGTKTSTHFFVFGIFQPNGGKSHSGKQSKSKPMLGVFLEGLSKAPAESAKQKKKKGDKKAATSATTSGNHALTGAAKATVAAVS